MKRKNKIRILSIALIGIMLSILPMTILTAYATEPRAAAALMPDELGTVELYSDTTTTDTVSEGEPAAQANGIPEGFVLLGPEHIGMTLGKELSNTIIIDGTVTPQYINTTNETVSLFGYIEGSIGEEPIKLSINTSEGKITQNNTKYEINAPLYNETWEFNNGVIVPISDTKGKIEYFNRDVDWNNWIYVKENTIPEGYRLLTEADNGKRFGYDLDPTIWIDTTKTPDIMPETTVNMGRAVFAFFDNTESPNKTITFAETFLEGIRNLFVDIDSNESFSLWNSTDSWINENINELLNTDINEMYVVTTIENTDALDFSNDWLYVKDIEPPAATIPGEEMKPVLTSLISLMVAGITALAGGIGSGLTNLVTGIFLATENGEIVGLSTFGAVIIIFAGVSLAISLSRWVVNYVTSLGN